MTPQDTPVPDPIDDLEPETIEDLEADDIAGGSGNVWTAMCAGN